MCENANGEQNLHPSIICVLQMSPQAEKKRVNQEHEDVQGPPQVLVDCRHTRATVRGEGYKE